MKKIVHLACLTLFLFPFSLQAHVELTNPQGGETFYSGDTVIIQWKQLATHDTQNWELYYSPDGGANWEVISKSIGVSVREYAWVVPAEASTKGKIKVFMNNLSDQDYEDISPNFSIENTTGIGAHPSDEALFASFKITPNPVRSNTHFQFEIKQSEQLSIRIFNLQGQEVSKLAEGVFQEGHYRIPWQLDDLNAGPYFCVLKTATASKTFKIQIIR